MLNVAQISERSRLKTAAADRLELPDGSYVTADGAAAKPFIRIYSNQNDLVLEYDLKAGKVTVSAQTADLMVNAGLGDVVIAAGNSIRLEADRVDLIGRSKIGFTLGKAYERLRSTLSLLPGAVELAAQKFNFTAKRCEIDFEEVRTRSKKAIHRVEHLQTIADSIETAARALVEKTRSSHRWSEDISQSFAGRMRMVISETLHIKSKNAIVKSTDDVKIKAEKIHLG